MNFQNEHILSQQYLRHRLEKKRVHTIIQAFFVNIANIELEKKSVKSMRPKTILTFLQFGDKINHVEAFRI